jgi:transcriptional regulator with XRE-family HTH domain
MKKVISKFLRVTRAKHQLTQLEMSKFLGVNRSNYARYESTGVISAENLLNLMLCLKIKPSELDEYYVERKKQIEKENSEKPEISHDELRERFLREVKNSLS